MRWRGLIAITSRQLCFLLERILAIKVQFTMFLPAPELSPRARISKAHMSAEGTKSGGEPTGREGRLRQSQEHNLGGADQIDRGGEG